MHTQAPTLLLYMPACIHTPTCRHTQKHKHSPVFVLESMGHLIYKHTLCLDPRCTYTRGDRLCFQLLDGICDNVKRNLPEDFIYRERLPQRRGKCNTHSDLLSEGGWKGEGRGRVKTAIFLFFPSQSPLLLPGVASLSLALDETQEEASSRPAEGIQEKRLYRVLIL